MVYCGKPSKSCRQCRLRGIKCDKKKDSCGQCRRAKLRCPGYPDPKKLIFIDQTDNTILKACSSPTFKLSPVIKLPINECAKQLFISRHVYGAADFYPVLSYMRLFHPTNPREPHVSMAVRAASLAYYYSLSLSPDALQTARKTYSTALTYAQKALHDAKAVSKDTTLLTVLLLNLFESLTKDDEAEIRHLEGAIALVKLRGEAQFEEPVALCMFMHLNSTVLSSCLKRGVEVPRDFVAMRSQVGKVVDQGDFEWQFSELVVRFAALRAELMRGLVTGLEAAELVRAFNAEFTILLRGLESIPKAPLDTRLDSMGRNNFHLVRDLLNDMIRQHCSDVV